MPEEPNQPQNIKANPDDENLGGVSFAYSLETQKEIEKLSEIQSRLESIQDQQTQQDLEKLPPEQRERAKQQIDLEKQYQNQLEIVTQRRLAEIYGDIQPLKEKRETLEEERNLYKQQIKDIIEKTSRSKAPELDIKTQRKRLLISSLILGAVAGIGALLGGRANFGGFIGGLGMGLQELVKGNKEAAKEYLEYARQRYKDWLEEQYHLEESYDKLLQNTSLSIEDIDKLMQAKMREAGSVLRDYQQYRKVVGRLIKFSGPAVKTALMQDEKMRQYEQTVEDAKKRIIEENPEYKDRPDVVEDYVRNILLPKSSANNQTQLNMGLKKLNDQTYRTELRNYDAKKYKQQQYEGTFLDKLKRYTEHTPKKQSMRSEKENEQLNRAVVEKLPELPAIGITKENKNRTILRTMEFEGFQSTPFVDNDKKKRVGYSTYARDNDYFSDDAMGREAAAHRLLEELQMKANTMRELIGADKWNKLTPEQRYALTDLAFHFGEGRMKDILNVIAKGDFEEVARLLTEKRYMKLQGDLNEGFTERAQWRRSLWESGLS